MPNLLREFTNKAFVGTVLTLGIDVVLLFVVFNFVAVAQMDIAMGLTMFVLSTILLLFGYMLGILLIGLLGILVLTRFWSRASRPIA